MDARLGWRWATTRDYERATRTDCLMVRTKGCWTDCYSESLMGYGLAKRLVNAMVS
jgi:hypothetical protein